MTAPAADNSRVLPVYPQWVRQGLQVQAVGGMKVRVSPGHADFDGQVVSVRGGEFEVSPSPAVSVRDEKLVLSEDKPQSWAHGTTLKQCACFGNGHGTPLPGCLKRGSLRVKSAPGEAGQVYEEGTDYLVDWSWGKLGRAADGHISKGQPVYVDYQYYLARLDSLAVSPDGTCTLVQGEAAPTCPLPPDLPQGARRLANILVWYGTPSLTQKLLFPCGPPFPEPDQTERERRQAFVAHTLAKLRAGQDVTIVTWGDSVTVGGDAQPMKEKAFAYLFITRLREKYPQATIHHVNAGIGGSSTYSRLAGLEADVLAHHPDLVTIEFVNDCGLSPEMLKKNWREAIGKMKAQGAEVIVITPHWTMPPWMGMSYGDLWGRDRRPAVQAMREVAEEMHVGLADASRRWEHLAQEGLPYITLLHNGINHPDNRGHELFVKELMTFF